MCEVRQRLTRFWFVRRETKAVSYACSLYKHKFGRNPLTDENLVLNLSDNPERRLCWSATSGALPTFRTNSKRIYHICREQWMTPRDRLAALGLPVSPGVALSMGVPILPAPCLSDEAVSPTTKKYACFTMADVQIPTLNHSPLICP